MNKKVIILSALSATLLIGGSSVYGFAMMNTKKANSDVVSTVKQSATTKSVAEVEQPTEATPVVEQTATAPVEQQVEQVAPVYRTFDEIIMDYPNMSSSQLLIDCSKVIERFFPYRFTDEKRETNIRIVSVGFATSCSAAYRGQDFVGERAAAAVPMYLKDYDGTGDYWQKNGGL